MKIRLPIADCPAFAPELRRGERLPIARAGAAAGDALMAAGVRGKAAVNRRSPGTSPGWTVKRPEGRAPGANAWSSLHASRFTLHAFAFTLVELLTVIAVIGVLAAFLFPVMGRVKRSQDISRATAEMAEIEAGINNYHADKGFYPPGDPTNALINQLYYELEGTYTNSISGQSYYVTFDGSQILMGNVPGAFGIGGFLNTGTSNRAAAGEDVRVARPYLPDLHQSQLAMNGNGVKILVYSLGGPEYTYKPLPDFTNLQSGALANPWRYNSANPTNNPGAYDLWVQLVFGRTTNLVCNWTKQAQLNSPLP